MAKPISPTLPQSDISVRPQTFKDVANLPSDALGVFLNTTGLSGALNGLSSLRNALTGNTNELSIPKPFPDQGALSVDAEPPQWFKDQVQNSTKQSLSPDTIKQAWMDYATKQNNENKTGFTSDSSQKYYNDLLDGGASPTAAFWKTALKTVGDISVLVPLARNTAKVAALAANPTSLIDAGITKESAGASKQEIFDYLSGRTPVNESPIPQELREAISDTMKNGTREEKQQILQGLGGVQTLEAEPSRLGKLLGLSQDEAEQILEDTYGTTRNAPAGELPGYRAQNPSLVPAGLSAEAQEPVGFGENNPTKNPGNNEVTVATSQNELGIDNNQTNSNIDTNGNSISQPQTRPGPVAENSSGAQPVDEGLSRLSSVVHPERGGSDGIRTANDREDEALYQGEQSRGYSEAAVRHAKFDLIDRGEDFGKLKPDARISLASNMLKEYNLPSSISTRFEQVAKALPPHIQENFDGLKYTDTPGVNASLGINSNSKWSLNLNPHAFNNQLYKNTRLIDHEITGHLTYRMTKPETRVKINSYGSDLLNDEDTFNEIWTGGRNFTPEELKNTKANYAHTDIYNITDELGTALGSGKDAVKIISELGFADEKGNTPIDPSIEQLKRVMNAKQTVLSYLEQNNPKVADKLRIYLTNNISDFANEVFARSVEYSAEHPIPVKGEVSDMIQKLSTGATPSDLYEPNSARKDYASLADQEPRSPKEQKLDQLHRQLQRAADSLRAANENPEGHAKAYGANKAAEYKAKINDLNEKINELTNNSPTKQKSFELEQTRGDLENMLEDHPAKDLMKYVSKSTGRLPEVTGKSTMQSVSGSGKTVQNSAFGKMGDDIAASHYPDVEQAQQGVEEYQNLRDRLETVKDEMRSMKPEIAKDRVADMEKSELEKKEARAAKKAEAEQADRELRAQFDPLITDRNADVIPPEVRGGLRAPEVEWDKFKDKTLIALQRETMNRNIESVAPDKATANKLKEFLTDKVTENETDKVRAANALRTEIADKMKSLGIKMSDKDIELIMHLGEGRMSLEEAAKHTNRAPVLKEAADYFRSKYDQIIDQWNQQLKNYGFKEVPKRPDYFRHFDDVDFFTRQYGFLTNKNMNNLPTSIAGDTEFFKPNKPFSNASLRRLGHQTSYNPIKGMDNYIDSVYRQIYHTDSVQRGRAIQKYIQEVSKAKEAKGDPIQLQNFKMALTEYTDSQLAGKLATIDRAIEKTVGRPVINAIQKVSKIVGKNIILGNLSSAMSHLVSIPLNLATTDKIPMVKGIMHTLTSPLKAAPFNTIDGQESNFLTRRYPKEYIMPSKVDTLEHAMGVFMNVSDRFKVKLAVSGKYFEGREAGLTKQAAMKAADEYAARIVGDATTGNKPNIMNNRSAQLFAQFQLGLNDGISVLAHDIPYQGKGKADMISKYIQYAIYVWLLNHFVFKKSRGSGRGIDPIDLGATLLGLNDEGKSESIPKRFASAGGDLAGELPFTNMFSGDFPVKEALPDVTGLLTGKTSVKTEAERLGSDLLSPFGGGAQALKTIKGITDVKEGSTFSNTGKKKAFVPDTTGNYIRGVLFGPSSLETGHKSSSAPKNSNLSGIKLTKKTNGGIKLTKNAALKGIKLVKKSGALLK